MNVISQYCNLFRRNKKKTKQKTYLGKTKYKNTMIHHRHDLEGQARSQVTS